jgi:hypothetical protein
MGGIHERAVLSCQISSVGATGSKVRFARHPTIIGKLESFKMLKSALAIYRSSSVMLACWRSIKQSASLRTHALASTAYFIVDSNSAKLPFLLGYFFS